MRKFVVFAFLAAVLVAIGSIFWYQEMQYLLPTPIPTDYKVVAPNEIIRYDSVLLPANYSKPKLLHFFNPDCPCSKFNLAHFQSLKKKYGNDVEFFVVVAEQQKIERAKKYFGTDVTILLDNREQLAQACGVYSTPQAAILQTNNALYYRGNYNRARYCTDKKSNYVQMALDSLMGKKQAPHFSSLATDSYGCSLPKKSNNFSLND